MAKKSRVVAIWSSSYDCIKAQINNGIKRAIYK